MAGVCERDNEPSVSTKMRVICVLIEDLQGSQKRLCSIVNEL